MTNHWRDADEISPYLSKIVYNSTILKPQINPSEHGEGGTQRLPGGMLISIGTI